MNRITKLMSNENFINDFLQADLTLNLSFPEVNQVEVLFVNMTDGCEVVYFTHYKQGDDAYKETMIELDENHVRQLRDYLTSVLETKSKK